MSIKKISYGIIGSGKHALNVFIPALSESYNSRLMGLTQSGSPDACIKSESHENNSIERYKVFTLGELLNDVSIDAVYIAAPNSDHFEIVKEVLSVGKHVLCEKPLCYRQNEIESLEQMSFSKHLLCAGFMYRLHPQYRTMRNLLGGEEIVEIRGGFSYQSDLSVYNIRNDHKKGGGALLDIGCYLLDAIRYIAEARELNLSINKIDIENEIDVELEIHGRAISNNAEIEISLELSQRKERKQFLEIKTKSKIITLSSPFLTPRNKKASINVSNINGKKETIYMSPFNQVCAQINLFSESILQQKLLAPLTDGIQNSKDLASLYSDIRSFC